MKEHIKIFISHSSKDKELVNILVLLLQTSLNLKSSEILCTSLNGHTLDFGTQIDKELFLKANKSDEFIFKVMLQGFQRKKSRV